MKLHFVSAYNGNKKAEQDNLALLLVFSILSSSGLVYPNLGKSG